ncbi:hypothetical protein DSL72_003451 [Monilinia vaccinii-corymbosi]|uniref:Deacetylase sirtuin-type domain-containing protein n=1 Tax=Monilinia vaccinii-corymbosi TaxID=61207 RepID=A0A8A3NZQ9_9HELO|nr:hypothetical protein DSL72_003451 [Monilinia vaccinii-corymbosi]
MASATLHAVDSVAVRKLSVSKIINLVSDDEDSEIDDATLNVISPDASLGEPHHQNALPQEVDRALSANESSSGDEDEDEQDDDEDEDEDSDSDDIESLYEDLIEGLTDESIYDNHSDPEQCTREEALKYRSDLRRLGPRDFCESTVEAGVVTAKKLLTAFGVRPPDSLEGEPDQVYYNLLGYALRRELARRWKLPQYNSVADAVELIKNAKKIIVLTGAGISTSLGIPDFRSANGLYAQLDGLGLNDPQDVFNIEVFRDQPEVFFGIAKMIIPTIVRYSPTHKFIWLLQNKGKLLTNYTQNIDNIESLAGILPENIVHCHGSFASATCQKCGHKVKGEDIFQEINGGDIPRCKKCATRPTQNLKRKRSSNSGDKKRRRYSDDDDDNEEEDLPQAGVMKPDITFFGEQLPSGFSDRLSKRDKDQVDLVITIGTSLKVAPVSEVVPYLPSNVPQIQINRDPISHLTFDIDLLGECDIVVSALCKALGWNLEHEMIPKDQEIEISAVPEHPSRHIFKQRGPEKI